MSTRRRGNGEGTIVKRADGRWAAAIIFDGYQRKWIYGKTRRDVSDRLRKIRGDIAEGRTVMNERLTMAEYLNRWLYEVAKQRTRPMTWRASSTYGSTTGCYSTFPSCATRTGCARIVRIFRRASPRFRWFAGPRTLVT